MFLMAHINIQVALLTLSKYYKTPDITNFYICVSLLQHFLGGFEDKLPYQFDKDIKTVYLDTELQWL